MYNIILYWAKLFLRLYFRRTMVHGKENIPAQGPLIVASNHPSAFMEAAMLATVMGRQLHFLVRGDVFHPKFRWLFNWTNQIPIYRQKDGISNLRKNASSFDLTYKKLAEGNAVLIFPEAKTILEKKMRPIQRGTAHLAFGTLPLLKTGDELTVIPVGVNFMDPRTPGTDVVIRFGQPFITQHATRENREAIEAFTETLSNALDPLIIQVTDHRNEKKYDVLASVYLKSSMRKNRAIDVHEDLKKIANAFHHPEDEKGYKEKLTTHISLLRKMKMTEGIYFPGILIGGPVILTCLIVLKTIWFITGGWIWRLVRHTIFSKIKTDTFQGPTSLGVSMVIFPVLSLLLLGICWIAFWPWWIVLIWWVLLALGKLVPEPLPLMIKSISMSGKVKKVLKSNLDLFRKILEKEII